MEKRVVHLRQGYGGQEGHSQKETFMYIFIILAVVLMLMPFITTLNDLLTRLVMSIEGYRVIQDFVVPYEVKMVALLLNLFGFEAAATSSYVVIAGKDSPFLAEIVWNCIGWQSLVFFLITLIVGLQGEYRLVSKIKAIILGFFGTFLVNILRIVLATLIAYWFGQKFALIFHDYSSILIMISWLIFFWWFAYRYVLE